MSTTEVQAKFARSSVQGLTPSVRESSDRKFRTWRVAEATTKNFAPEPVFSAVECGCRDVLGLWPNAKAAILFGSRARGDHREDSDWDIAFITSAEEALPCEVLRYLNDLEKRDGIEVQAQAISQALFRDGVDSLGSIAASIARDGRVIAGHCQWPETESEPVLKPNEYQEWRLNALKHIASASANLENAANSTRKGNIRSSLKGFVADSSDAAEYFAKIAFGRLASGSGVDIPKKHEVNQIVAILDSNLEREVGQNARWWRSDRGKEFRELLRMMNGHGNADHQSGYPGPAPSAVVTARAANRLIVTVKFAIREVEELPDPGNLRQAAIEVAGDSWISILGSARRLRKSLQDFAPSDSRQPMADSKFAKSVSVAFGFCQDIAKALEQLADSLFEEIGADDSAEGNPVAYVVGFRPDGSSLAIADNLEAMMDRADEISKSRLPREDAGLKLFGSPGFNEALRILGFKLEPQPRLYTESKAMELVGNPEALGPEQFEFREALAKLFSDGRIGRPPNSIGRGGPAKKD